MTRSDALRDLAERLAEIAGGARLVANALGTAAIAAGEMLELEPSASAPRRPQEVPVQFVAHDEAGSFSISPLNGEPLAYTETREVAERIVAALSLLAAVEENSNARAQG